MKILRLDLRAFGPFTDLALDLSAGQEGLHLIYGPNEAGKSTALRAIEQMLFGIPQRSTDDFLHPYKNLRVGGTLRSGDGREI
ncbi:MAG: AAA family ATPase, partial [Thermoguttaceae bacterium]|nr:AAA family ATPase [Thermoguttaceae bacterium]